MIVVDSQMLVYNVIPGPFSDLAVAVRRADPVWIAPPICRCEVRNVLAGYVRAGTITQQEWVLRYIEAEGLLLPDREPELPRMSDLIVSSKCTAYDLEFVAVAQALGITLVTNDKEVLAAFPETAVSPADFVS